MALPTDPKPAAPPEPFIGVYTMFYRKDSNHLQSKNFRYPGDLKGARARAEKHCEVIGARLNFVQPLISDLSKEETYYLAGGGNQGATIAAMQGEKA